MEAQNGMPFYFVGETPGLLENDKNGGWLS